MTERIKHAPDMTRLERYRPLIDRWADFVQTLHSPLPTTFWTHPYKTSPAELSTLLRKEGVELRPVTWLPGAFRMTGAAKPGSLWPYKAGLYNLMEEVSMLPAILLEPRPGERILDLCAAPGSKTLHIASLMSQRGTVVANDLNGGRLSALRDHMDRMGFPNITVTMHDGTNLNRHAGVFDRVLCDAPCSCEGTVRKNPAVLAWGEDYWKKLQSAQKALLRKALQLVKVKGRVVYSTCTFAPEENESVVNALLTEFKECVKLVPARVRGFQCSEGLREWNGEVYDEAVRQCMRVWPHQNDTGGFFVAIFEKTANHPVWEPYPESHHFTTVDARDLSVKKEMGILAERFSIEPSYFSDLNFVRDAHGDLFWVPRDHKPPLEPQNLSNGMMFMRSSIGHPKMPTAVANMIAKKIRRNVVDLTREQIDVYLARQTLVLPPEQLRACDVDGYVFVRHSGHGLGQGLLHRDENGEARLFSLFPKALAT